PAPFRQTHAAHVTGVVQLGGTQVGGRVFREVGTQQTEVQGFEAFTEPVHVHAVGRFPVHTAHRRLVDAQEDVVDGDDLVGGRITDDLGANGSRTVVAVIQDALHAELADG